MKRRTFLATAAALAAAPRFAWGQGARIPRVALVDRGEVPANMTEAGHPYWGALLGELRRLGYVDRESISIERWTGRGKTNAEFAELARDVVATRPDVIVARSAGNIRNFRAATATIPIVGLGTFPDDLFARIARPGGNVTGMDATAGGAVHQKRFQLLHDAMPSATRIAMLGQNGGFCAAARTLPPRSLALRSCPCSSKLQSQRTQYAMRSLHWPQVISTPFTWIRSQQCTRIAH